MSAVPSHESLADEEFEILASRYLDGELSPDERAEFETYLSKDAGASARYDALHSMVEEYRSLPHPDTPFALSTRIAARVQEQAVGLSGVLLRLGVVRRMGAVFILMAGLGVVAIYYLANLGGPSPQMMAAKRGGTGEFVPEKDIEGPVQVFFEGKPQTPGVDKDAADSKLPAEPVLAASSEGARADDKKAEEMKPALRDEDQVGAGAKAVSQPEAVVAQAVPEREKKEALEPRSEVDASADRLAAASAPAAVAPAAPAAPAAVGMAMEARAAQPAGAMPAATAGPAVATSRMAETRPGADRQATNMAAPAPAPASAAKGKRQAGPAVSVTGPGGKAAEWRLVRPSEPPPMPTGGKALYHVALDGDGKVRKVVRLSGSASAMDEWLKGARFEKVAGEAAGNELEVKVEAHPE